jgi:predicted secreted protein
LFLIKRIAGNNMKNLESYDCSHVPEKPEKSGNMNEVMVIGHCLLNPLARIKRAKPPLPIDTKGANVIQLPCPEAMFFGMRRREITRDQLDHPAYRRFMWCRNNQRRRRVRQS